MPKRSLGYVMIPRDAVLDQGLTEADRKVQLGREPRFLCR